MERKDEPEESKDDPDDAKDLILVKEESLHSGDC